MHIMQVMIYLIPAIQLFKCNMWFFVIFKLWFSNVCFIFMNKMSLLLDIFCFYVDNLLAFSKCVPKKYGKLKLLCR